MAEYSSQTNVIENPYQIRTNPYNSPSGSNPYTINTEKRKINKWYYLILAILLILIVIFSIILLSKEESSGAVIGSPDSNSDNLDAQTQSPSSAPIIAPSNLDSDSNPANYVIPPIGLPFILI